MLDEKDLKTLKEKSCNEISKISRRMEQQSDVPKADLENLVLALKAWTTADILDIAVDIIAVMIIPAGGIPETPTTITAMTLTNAR